MDYFTGKAKAVLGIIALLIVAYFAVAIYGKGVTRGEANKQTEIETLRAGLAQATAQAERIQRDEEQRRQQAIDEERENARKQIALAEADAAAANDVADSMREQARRFASRASQASCNTGTASGGQATSHTCMVLADLLSRADQRAGELAHAYDRARAAGLSCERAYDSLEVAP